MAILSTNQRLINVGDSYSAGNGIDITNNIISVTGDNAPYSAGDNIDIQDHIISGKDWSNDIEQASANAYNVTTAWVQDNYANSADMTYISAMVDTKLDTSAWSSVSGDLATESYVIMADNITYERAKGYVDSKGFATEEFVNENTSGKLDSTAFDTWQQGQYTNDIASLNNLIGTKLDASSFEETSGTFYPTSNPSGFITGVDLSNYYTKDETSGKEELANAFANIPVGDPEVNAYVTSNSASIDESTDLVQSNSSTWNDVTAYQSNSANYITAHQDISNLMPKSESANFYPMTGNPSGFINTLPEEEEVEFEEINLSSFATSSQINDLSAAIDYVSANAGDEFPASADEAIQCVQSNSSNWQSVSNKLDSDVFTAWSANQADNNYQLSAGDGISIIDDDINKITRIDCTAQGGDMFTSYLEYNDQNQISGYAGSAFAGQGGGGDVPTGTMNVSGLDYNAVNEISGYNGSAIAQYGAEKQWLVHDDTLVHAANSAQYALGVAIDNVARLMGVDETELLSSTANSAFTLTEPFSSFKQVKIKLRWWDKVPDNYYDVERFTNNKCSLSWTYFDNITDGGPLELAGASWTSNNGIDYNLEGGFARTFGITSTGMGHFTLTPYPLSIVGIGRKQ